MQAPRHLSSCQTNQDSLIPYLCLQMHLDNRAIGQENRTPGNIRILLFASITSSKHLIQRTGFHNFS